ncbi:aromatic amino acid hydroxylase [Simiduia curdlanivorans]|uniref:Aromatic amino acid hydroxylase n=1 Tax=Simiduia curdlanivorans TaxID=1492769 RepID=A0ABV8UZK0_9GAMM|nr:aromatic amino acid hydroxylase [Simiduia curdlanivorans]MDN3638036.1 aromatic amino acid hydroxylase [Simiduia curdlanivorans]
MSQQEIIASLPAHLRQFVKVQDYNQYTPRDHAAWRFLLLSLIDHMATHAHPVYLEGLRKTGISADHIPSIDEMNQCLGKIGWQAVVVDGFIPPAIFMEFQARKILVIALDMRTIDHMLYTPAPDIVHESAGHAPFIVDVDYAEFLQRFGEIGMKALSTASDYAVYEAIRHLSIVKEAVRSKAEDIDAAEAALAEALRINAAESPSEASLLSRLHWWTVEYGLVGELDDYKIYGAGLLSSLGEGVNCLDDNKVRKLPLTVDAINTPYDITREQPQLFVTKSCKHLTQVLETFAHGMAFRKGGAESVRKAIVCKTVCTTVYSSGLQVSGKLVKAKTDAMDNLIYIGTEGPTQLAWAGRELHGHGVDYHAQGFGSPVGKIKDMPRCLSEYTMDELKSAGIVVGQRTVLDFVSGVHVEGLLDHVERREHKNILFSFSDCRVVAPMNAKGEAGETLFEPSWGQYDMAVGDRIISVFGGTADKDRYRLYDQEDAEPTARVHYSTDEASLFSLYQELRDARTKNTISEAFLLQLHAQLDDYPHEWLLRFECLELTKDTAFSAKLHKELEALAALSAEHKKLIATGCARLPC